jgi:hypothetical protein
MNEHATYKVASNKAQRSFSVFRKQQDGEIRHAYLARFRVEMGRINTLIDFQHSLLVADTAAQVD